MFQRDRERLSDSADFVIILQALNSAWLQTRKFYCKCRLARIIETNGHRSSDAQSECMLRVSTDGKPSIHQQVCASDEGRTVGRQEQCCFCDIGGRSQAPPPGPGGRLMCPRPPVGGGG